MAQAGVAEAGGAVSAGAVSALRPRLAALGRRLAAPRGAGGDGERPQEGGDGDGPCPAFPRARSALCCPRLRGRCWGLGFSRLPKTDSPQERRGRCRPRPPCGGSARTVSRGAGRPGPKTCTWALASRAVGVWHFASGVCGVGFETPGRNRECP